MQKYIMRALVIGTSGQLALALRRASLPTGVDLIAPERIDISDETATLALLDRLRPGLILNAAAYTAVDRAETEATRAFAVNAQGPETLARWCSRNGSTLLHVSTDYVFDGTKPEPYAETDTVGPVNVYGASKLDGEVRIRTALARHVILRVSWLFSADGQNFVKTMLRLAAERPELRVVADQRGRPTFAGDLASAMLRIAASIAAGQEPNWGTYHFAGTGETSWHGFASEICAAQASFTGKQPRVTPIPTSDYPTPARRPQNSVLATTLFEENFGFAPAPWREGLRAVVPELLRASAR